MTGRGKDMFKKRQSGNLLQFGEEVKGVKENLKEQI